MPEIRPFRALRYDPSTVGDLAQVVAPPYDVIDEPERRSLIGRHPANVVRLDLPVAEQGDAEDDRYRRAARTLASWRSDGTLHKDPRPSIYVYEQAYCVPGTNVERTQRGFFGRLRLEPFGSGSGVLPHERTLAAPKEDRYKLLRATGVNTSPVVVLYEDGSGTAAAVLAEVTARPPDIDVTDGDGVRHRLWALPAEADAAPGSGAVGALLGAAGRAPVTIADGHHRYETALRYRDERRMSRACEEDPAFDYILSLCLDVTAEPLTVLPTHRIVRNLGADGVARFHSRLPELFEVEDGVSATQLRERFDGIALAAGGAGRFGLWTGDGGALLTARRPAFAALLGGESAVRDLDVSLLGAALEHIAGVTPEAVAAGAVAYSKSPGSVIEAVDGGVDGADLGLLLEPTPVRSILEVAREGDVMPQKSTYFYPKALTGLVINPHEW